MLANELRSRINREPSGCWRWTGTITAGGYGKLGGKLAHRLVFESLVGPILAGFQIDHLCRRRDCVNPEHLEVVTQRENILRGIAPSAINARKTHCNKGHPFTPENTYYDAARRTRRCRICQLNWNAKSRRRVSC